MKKWKFRVMTIIIIILGISLQFLRLFIENIEWLSYLGLPILILGIFLFINTFEFQKSHISIEEKLINKTEFPSHSIVLRNINGISKYKTMAFVRYAFPGNPNDFDVNITFDVCEGNRKVAAGIIKSKRENVDI